MGKEAKARILINSLLTDAGWSFFDDGHKKATVLTKDEFITHPGSFEETILEELRENSPFERLKLAEKVSAEIAKRYSSVGEFTKMTYAEK